MKNGIPNVFSYLSVKNALRLFVVVNSVLKATGDRLSTFDTLETSKDVVPRFAADPAAWAAIAAAIKSDVGVKIGGRLHTRPNRRTQGRRQLGGVVQSHQRSSTDAAARSSAPHVPGKLPPSHVNGPAGAWEIPGLGARKRILQQACVACGIVDPVAQAQILAAALIEGDLTSNTDPDKLGLSATRGVFNLNVGMIRDLGLESLETQAHDVQDLPTSLAASVQIIRAAIEKYGINGFKLWQRGGQTLKDAPIAQAQRFGWASYNAAFDNTVAYLGSGSGLTDDFRYAERVPAV